jgi:hypothetical protein
MKREKARTFIIDEWGKIEDLKEKVYYFAGLAGELTGRRVFIGKYPDMWYGRNGKYRYLAFNLDGSFCREVDMVEMRDSDVKRIWDNKKYEREFEKYRKLVEDIGKIQAEQARIKQKRSEVIVKSDINA